MAKIINKNIQADRLPQASSHVQLHLLDGGSFVGQESKIHAGGDDSPLRLYDWAFHIYDQSSGRHVLWDLGLSSDGDKYTEWVRKNLLEPTCAVGPRISLQTQLVCDHGVQPDQIDAVLFSHAHYDHCRPIAEEFVKATGYFGPGTLAHCSGPHAHPQWDSRFFDTKTRSERFQELTGPWDKFGPFEKAMDFFGNGSFWIIQAPGHMPGNLCAAARVEGGQWVLLGSDCCHSRALLDGTRDFAVFHMPGVGNMCLQADLEAAQDTVKRIRIAEQELGVHVALAHDTQWMKCGNNVTLMNLLTPQMKIHAENKIKSGEPL